MKPLPRNDVYQALNQNLLNKQKKLTSCISAFLQKCTVMTSSPHLVVKKRRVSRDAPKSRTSLPPLFSGCHSQSPGLSPAREPCPGKSCLGSGAERWDLRHCPPCLLGTPTPVPTSGPATSSPVSKSFSTRVLMPSRRAGR